MNGMFDDRKTIRLLRADAERIAVPGTDGGRQRYAEKKRYARFTVKFAACTALAIAMVLAGTLWLPGKLAEPVSKQSGPYTPGASSAQTVSHDFVLQAYAAEPSGSIKHKVTLALNMKVTLPTGKLRYHTHSGLSNGRLVGGSDFDQSNGFLCSGKNLVSVKYTAAGGRLSYTSNELFEQQDAAYKNSIVCTFKVPKNKLKTGQLFQSFSALWKSGALDAYRNKYFNGKDIDLKRYEVTIETQTEAGSYTYSEGHGSTSSAFTYRHDKGADSAANVVTIRDSKKDNFDINLLLDKKSITAKASDHNAALHWSLSDRAWAQVSSDDERYEETGKVDYSGIPGDRITVTGTFTDGQKATKYINLSFNSSGSLCAKLTDK
jgi:hypothetical protein